MPIRYRPIATLEIPEAVDLFLTALADLARRNGLAPPAHYTREAVEPVYRYIEQTGIFEVAEHEGRIVGICCATVRDTIWFLAMFWVLPEMQLKGVGRPLLERVMAEGTRRGARTYCTWSSIDFAAVGLYLKLGLMPECPIFTFTGRVVSEPHVPADLELRALELDDPAAIDTVVRGTPRPGDHRFWREQGAQGFQVQRGQQRLGYFYVNQGSIGPAAWLRASDGPALLACALRAASERSSTVKLITLGNNPCAVRAAVDAGLRLGGASHWLRSRPFGQLDQYVPSGPALF
jgi:GNAT superfamily N-acetyltransferase